MVAVGILKKYSVLKFTLSIINLWAGSSYIPLPDFILRKKAIINIRNQDQICFLWSVVRYLHPSDKNEIRINNLKKYENELNTKDIDFPVKLKDIAKFESQNPSLPGINVSSISENNKFYPLRINKKDCQKSVDLFLCTSFWTGWKISLLSYKKLFTIV